MATFGSRGPLEGCEPFAREEASREEEQSLGARFKLVPALSISGLLRSNNASSIEV